MQLYSSSIHKYNLKILISANVGNLIIFRENVMYLRLKSVWAVEMIQGIEGLFVSLAI